MWGRDNCCFIAGLLLLSMCRYTNQEALDYYSPQNFVWFLVGVTPKLFVPMKFKAKRECVS